MTTTRQRPELVDRIAEPRLRRESRDDAHKLTAIGGLAALSLDALSSVAYGPEAIVVALVAAGVGAVRFTLPISIGIAVLLMVLVVSYRQVIAVHPDGGGAYAVGKKDLDTDPQPARRGQPGRRLRADRRGQPRCRRGQPGHRRSRRWPTIYCCCAWSVWSC